MENSAGGERRNGEAWKDEMMKNAQGAHYA
jgi:hypothetical protein